MKTARARFLLRSLVLGIAAVPPAICSVEDKPPVVMDSVVVSEPKTHTLFMGADISVDFQKDLRPVQDVFGSSWVVLVDGQERHLSTKEASVGLVFTPALKLTDTSATIVGFRKAPAYSFANDPGVRITQGLTRAAVVSSLLQNVSDDARDLAETIANKGLGPSAVFAGSDKQFGDGAMMTTAQFAFATTHPVKLAPGQSLPGANPNIPSQFASMSGFGDSQKLNETLALQGAAAAARQTENGTEPAGRLTTLGHDAMDVSFEVSSKKLLRNPYVVTMARFHPSGTKPGTVQNLVYAKALDPIDNHPSSVHFEEDGYPPEYELLDFQLHLYDKGKEIATNISDKRVEMTRDEAFEYVTMEYMSVHRSDTLPPVAAMGTLPPDLPTKLAIGKYSAPFYVRVSKKGLAEELFADSACSKKLEDPYLESVVHGLRFKPALAHGKPVEGVASLNLAKLQI